ncbi:tetratricopeptide repeat protein [Streptomyces microflavus]|uniref:tetratricopeptide repeat protein n=1 Tax=Streptomyces microflavus subgroup TaxID=1482601 RepID=UPI0006E2B3DB|nr:tetratricopeptide repeat protein [Streptomyces luridiscabiei]
MTSTLPAAPPRLAGRDEQIGLLLESLTHQGDGPSVTAVSGAPGVGKTALAVHAASKAASCGRFSGGVFFVTLRGYDPAGTVGADEAVTTLLRTMGLRDEELPATGEERTALFRAELAGLAQQNAPVLVVADDVSSAAQVLPLIPARREHRLLVTGRYTLSALPDARQITLDELAAAPAVELVTDTLLRARPNDPRPDQEPAALTDVVAHCGRLPLALVIASSLLSSDPGLRIAALAEQLADERTRIDRLHFAEGTGHTLAVRAAFALSYQRLDPAHRRVFRTLSVNPGPDIATETVTRLVDAPARPALAVLVRAGLLTEQPVGGDRWRMHDLIALYAAELAAKDSSQQETAQKGLLKYYVLRLAAAAEKLLGPDGPIPWPEYEPFTDKATALAWLDSERLNMLRVLDRVVADGMHEMVPAFAIILSPYLGLRRHFDDALAVGRHAVTAAEAVQDQHGEAVALGILGNALLAVRSFDEAIEVHSRSAALHRATGDLAGEAMTLNNLGLALREVGKLDEALEAHSRDLSICRDRGDRRREGNVLNNLGLVLQELDRFPEAVDALRASVALHRALQQDPMPSRSASVGDAVGTESEEVTEGAVDPAVARYWSEEAHHREAAALANLANALRGTGAYAEALDMHHQALERYRGYGDLDGEGTALGNLARTLQRTGRLDEAVDAFRRAIALHRELQDHYAEALALESLAGVLHRMRRTEEAVDAHLQAADALKATQDERLSERALHNVLLALATETRTARRAPGWLRARWRALRGR